ncbi:MAG: aspartyl protease family protein [Chthoniobacterales bacterium]
MQKVFPRASVRILQTTCCLAIAVLGLSVAQARNPLHLDAIERDGYGVVEMKQPVANEFFLEGSLNGHPIRLVLDTGFCSNYIMMTNATAAFLRVPPQPIKGVGHGVSGKAVGNLRKGIADSMVLGNVQVAGVPLRFASLPTLKGHAPEGLWRTDGMLGNERAVRNDANGFLGLGFLRTCAAIIDLSNRRLYLKAPGTGRTPNLGPALKSVGYSAAPFQLTEDGLLVDVSINGVSGKMIIDTGDDITLVDSRFAAQAKLKSYTARDIRMLDVTGTEMRPSMAELASFKIGGVEVNRREVQVGPVGFLPASGGQVIGLLGMDFMGQSWGIIDFADHKLYFTVAK